MNYIALSAVFSINGMIHLAAIESFLDDHPDSYWLVADVLNIEWRKGCLTTAGCAEPRFQVIKMNNANNEANLISWPITLKLTEETSHSFISHWISRSASDIALKCEVSGLDPTYGFPRICDTSPSKRIFDDDENNHLEHIRKQHSSNGKLIVEVRGKCFNASFALQKYDRCPTCVEHRSIAVVEQLVLAALNIATFVLKETGTFVAKVFRARDITLLYAQLKIFFKEVYCAKPRSSRQSSCEAFVVCKGFSLPKGYIPTMKNPMLCPDYDAEVNSLLGSNRLLVPFLACGDLSGWDSDRTYGLELPSFPGEAERERYKYRPAVQPPTEPAYKKACALKKSGKLARPEMVDQFLKYDASIQEAVDIKKESDSAGNLGIDDELAEAFAECFIFNGMRLWNKLFRAPREITVKYQPFIGLEIHAQIMTRTKLFSAAVFDDDAHANSSVALFDMAMPGTLPVLNKIALMKGIIAGLLLNCTIPERCQFVRKHYFYADMPAGYQITQQDHPIAHSGFFEFYVYCNDESFVPYKKRIDILRIQLEHDSGRTIHDLSNNRSLIDLNRAGIGLLEIVTSPSMNSALEAYCFIEQLRLILMENDLCEGEMQKAQFRVDVNVSLGEDNINKGIRIEIKNLNSLRMVRTAVNNEIARQYEILRTGGSILNETCTVDRYGNTITMREKEIETDYRFMPEPNLPPVHIEQEWIENCRPMLLKPRYLKNIDEYGIEPKIALKIANRKTLTAFVEVVLNICKDATMAPVLIEWTYLLQKICRNCNKRFPESRMVFISHFLEVIHLFHTKRLTRLTTFDLLRRYIETELDKSPTEIINKENLWRIHDRDEILRTVKKVFCENNKLVTKVQVNGTKRHITKLRTAILNECNRRIEADEINALRIRDVSFRITGI
ncbi:Glutamyl-tRNA(Gln) amidotransferase subunit B [Dirofilaria immitis]